MYLSVQNRKDPCCCYSNDNRFSGEESVRRAREKYEKIHLRLCVYVYVYYRKSTYRAISTQARITPDNLTIGSIIH
ncbi:unnamed protein product [Rotaria socialis]